MKRKADERPKIAPKKRKAVPDPYKRPNKQPSTSKQATEPSKTCEVLCTQTGIAKKSKDIEGQRARRTVRKHKFFKPRQLQCDVPFEQDLEYAAVVYKGYGPAVMIQGVHDMATICLSMKMFTEITRHLD